MNKTKDEVENDIEKVELALMKSGAKPEPIGGSLSQLFELRIGIANHALLRRWQEHFRSTLDWGRTYLPHHFLRPASPMHEWLGMQLDAFQLDRGLKVNLIGPRGHAKSTIATTCYVLRAAVEGWERYIWIVSDTIQQAILHLENVKWELTDNVQLAADYPLAVGKGRRWQRHVIELTNGVIIEAWSTGQRIRGRRRGEHRPTLIVCDDLQNDSHISSAVQREASRQWFHGTLLKAGTKRTNVLNLATALHRDALAMELLTAPGWNSKRFAAIETWPTNLDLWKEWEEIYTGGTKPPAEPGAECRNRPSTLPQVDACQPPALPGVTSAAPGATGSASANFGLPAKRECGRGED